MSFSELYNPLVKAYNHEKNTKNLQKFDSELMKKIGETLYQLDGKNQPTINFKKPKTSTLRGNLPIILEKCNYIEILTMKYYYAEYFRVRLTKIEKAKESVDPEGSNQNDYPWDYLSNAEKLYLEELNKIENEYLSRTLNKPIIDHKKDFRVENQTTVNFGFVFVVANVDLENIEVSHGGNTQEVYVKKNDVILVRQDSVLSYINDGSFSIV